MIEFMQRIFSALLCLFFLTINSVTAAESKNAFPFFDYITNQPQSRMIAYTPTGLDPRQESNQVAHPTKELKADLTTLRTTFDGLILYGYHPACTPRILALAKELKFRAVLLGIWQPKSATEVDGVATLVKLYDKDFALGVLVGNEGITFNRYETDDVRFAAARLRSLIPPNIPLATSEPLVGYQQEFFQNFGDFLAPNIHPVFDRPNLNAKEAAAWAREQAVELAKKSGKPVLLKETGFPHAGKSQFTPASQQDFWTAYTAPGLIERADKKRNQWVYFGVAFEAFDLPWKSAASGLPIEQSWGLYDKDRKPLPAQQVWQKLVPRI